LLAGIRIIGRFVGALGMPALPPESAESPRPDRAAEAPEPAGPGAAAPAAEESFPRLPALRPTPSIVPPFGDLADQARAYARNARAQNTRRAYESDWRHFLSWCRRRGLEAEEPNPETVGLYLAAGAAGEKSRRGFSAPPVSPATLEASPTSWT